MNALTARLLATGLCALVLASLHVPSRAQDRGGHPPPPPFDDRRDRDRDRDWDQGRDRDRHDHPPDWLIGRFHGYNGFYKAELAMRVSPEGRIETRSENTGQRGRYIGRGQIQFEDGKRFDVDRTRRGVRLVELGNRRNVSELTRER